ncbi:MAG: hypothetical protein AB7V77_04040 [Candidatus Woesearchaeota archaeon]
MVYEIVLHSDFFNKLTKTTQDFLRIINPSKENITFYLKDERTPVGNIDKDICQMLNDAKRDNAITNDERLLLKSFFDLNYSRVEKEEKGPNYTYLVRQFMKNNILNCDEDLEKLSEVTETPKVEVDNQLHSAINKIINYNLKLYNEKNKALNKHELIKKTYESLENEVKIMDNKDEAAEINNRIIALKTEHYLKIRPIYQKFQTVIYST